MTSKKKSKPNKNGAIWTMSAVEATLANKPLYNGYICGHGAHGKKGYDRNSEARRLYREIHDDKDW